MKVGAVEAPLVLFRRQEDFPFLCRRQQREDCLGLGLARVRREEGETRACRPVLGRAKMARPLLVLLGVACRRRARIPVVESLEASW